jgi:hypothetical protein
VQEAVAQRHGRVKGQQPRAPVVAQRLGQLPGHLAVLGVDREDAVDEHRHAVATHVRGRVEKGVQVVGRLGHEELELLARRRRKGADAHVREHRQRLGQPAPAALGRVLCDQQHARA